MTDTTPLRELPAKWRADAFAVVAAYGPGSDYGQALQMCIDELEAALAAVAPAGMVTDEMVERVWNELARNVLGVERLTRRKLRAALTAALAARTGKPGQQGEG